MFKSMKHRMMVFMTRRMIACDEASFLASYRMDRRLTTRQTLQLRIHLMTCHLCRRYARQLIQLSRTVEQYREGCNGSTCRHHLTPQKSEAIRDTVLDELNAK